MDGKRKIESRRSKILELLRTSGKISVNRLSQLLDVTQVTIRNDLTCLEQEGRLIRTQGGASLLPEAMLHERDGDAVANEPQKRAIGAAIADMIHDGDTLFINSGTTSECLADALRVRKNLNIVTNSLKVASILGAVPTFRVLLVGGEINARFGFTHGGDAQEQLSKYQADWAVLSVDGISARGGITTHHAEEAVIDRMMVASAKHPVIAADSSKLGRAGFSRVCECGKGLRLVTNPDADAETADLLRDSGIEILYA